MLKYTRPVSNEVLSDIWLGHPFTYDVVAEHIGEDTIARMAALSMTLVRHQFDTGEMTGDLLLENGCSETAQQLGRLSAGLHDFGKFRRDILGRVSSDRAFGTFERSWVRDEHSAEGGRQLRRQAAGSVANDLTAAGLYYAAFTADRHHTELLPPDEYAALPDRELALAYGITDCIKGLDPLQAMGFDKSRGYIVKREGRVLTARDVFDLVEQERGRNWSEPPIVEGIAVDLEGFVARALGLEMAGSLRI